MAKKDRSPKQPPDLIRVAEGVAAEREALYCLRIRRVTELCQRLQCRRNAADFLRWLVEMEGVDRWTDIEASDIGESYWLCCSERTVQRALRYWRQLRIVKVRPRWTEAGSKLPPQAQIVWGVVLNALGVERTGAVRASTSAARGAATRPQTDLPAAPSVPVSSTRADADSAGRTSSARVDADSTGPGRGSRDGTSNTLDADADSAHCGDDPARGGPGDKRGAFFQKTRPTGALATAKNRCDSGCRLGPSSGGPSDNQASFHGGLRSMDRVRACARGLYSSVAVTVVVDDSGVRHEQTWDEHEARAASYAAAVFPGTRWERLDHDARRPFWAIAILTEALFDPRWIEHANEILVAERRDGRVRRPLGFWLAVLREGLHTLQCLGEQPEDLTPAWFASITAPAEQAAKLYAPLPRPLPAAAPEEVSDKRREYEEALAIAKPGSRAAEHWRGKLAELAQTINPGR